MTNLETQKLIELARNQKEVIRSYSKVVNIALDIANSSNGVYLDAILTSSDCEVSLTIDLPRYADELDSASEKLSDAIAKAEDHSYSSDEVTNQVLMDAVIDAAEIVSDCQNKMTLAESCLTRIMHQITNSRLKFSQATSNAEFYKNNAVTIALTFTDEIFN